MKFREPFTASEREAIRALLRQVKLPTESVETGTTKYYLGEFDGSLAVVAGFEFYGVEALLRSVAVSPAFQRTGLGSQITDFMIAEAQTRGVQRIVLLTETAKRFFDRKGFRVVDRSTVTNDLMKQSSEFTYACPSSAVCMVLDVAVKP